MTGFGAGDVGTGCVVACDAAGPGAGPGGSEKTGVVVRGGVGAALAVAGRGAGGGVSGVPGGTSSFDRTTGRAGPVWTD